MSENINHKSHVEQQDIFFVTGSTLKGPGVNLHGDTGATLTKKVIEVKEDWNAVMGQVSVIVSETDTVMSETKFVLEEITISLGFNAKGKIAFIAEAGVEASIEIKFKKGK
jgi:hypothetical protein